jgi:hypothetical protein
MNANNRAAFKQMDEVFDGTHMLTFGGPLDAPETLPNGSMVAFERHALLAGSALRLGSYNEPRMSVQQR